MARTDWWCENLGLWKASIASAEVSLLLLFFKAEFPPAELGLRAPKHSFSQPPPCPPPSSLFALGSARARGACPSSCCRSDLSQCVHMSINGRYYMIRNGDCEHLSLFHFAHIDLSHKVFNNKYCFLLLLGSSRGLKDMLSLFLSSVYVNCIK